MDDLFKGILQKKSESETEIEYNFITDEFEDLIIEDLMRFDKDLSVKLNRNITHLLMRWLNTQIDSKKTIKINIRGSTRSGKSISSLAIINYVIKKDVLKGKKWFDEKIEWFVCGNQQEMINAFKTAEKSDFLQLDEKIFDNTGVGVHAVEEQLTNFDNVTAKKNIHSISITPKMFLTNNARIGLATWGRDEKHWMSRFLLYDLGVGNLPTLLGYIVIDVKPVFQDYGCYIFQDIKGCNNNARMPIEEIVKLPSYEKSTCFPKDYKPEDLNDCLLTCPLYKICKHPMARYEKKKDTWIDKTLKGGLEGRQASQIMASVQLIPYLCEFIYDEKKDKTRLMFRTSNKGETEEELALYISEISNISWGQNELKSIMTKINLAVKNPEQYRIYCEKTDLVMHEELMKIAGCTFELVEHYRTFTKLNKATKKASDKKVIWTEKDKIEKAKLTEMFNALEQEKQLEIISAWYHEMYKLPLVTEEKAVLENTIKRPKNEAQDLINSIPAEEVKSTLMESLDNWDEDLKKLAKPKKIRDESEDEETEILELKDD